jgi:hypothetical protein
VGARVTLGAVSPLGFEMACRGLLQALSPFPRGKGSAQPSVGSTKDSWYKLEKLVPKLPSLGFSSYLTFKKRNFLNA